MSTEYARGFGFPLPLRDFCPGPKSKRDKPPIYTCAVHIYKRPPSCRAHSLVLYHHFFTADRKKHPCSPKTILPDRNIHNSQPQMVMCPEVQVGYNTPTPALAQRPPKHSLCRAMPCHVTVNSNKTQLKPPSHTVVMTVALPLDPTRTQSPRPWSRRSSSRPCTRRSAGGCRP